MVSLTSEHNIDSVTQAEAKKKRSETISCTYITPNAPLYEKANAKFRVCCIQFMNQFCTYKCLYTELNCRSSMPLWRRPNNQTTWHTERKRDRMRQNWSNECQSVEKCLYRTGQFARTLGAKHQQSISYINFINLLREIN